MRRTPIIAAVLGAALASLPLSAGAQPTAEAVVWGSWFSQGGGYHKATPTEVSGIPGTVTEVATSNSDAYFLTAAGAVYAEGAGQNGELGDGGTVDDWSGPPVEVDFPAGVTITALSQDAMPYDGGLAIDSTGTPWFWGNGETGTSCKGKQGIVATPEAVPLSGVTAVAAASAHALYLVAGTLDVCGTNQYGAVGTGKTGACFTVCQVALPAGSAIVQIVASSDDSGALLATGAYYDWGSNAEGQVGIGSFTTEVLSPSQVPLPEPVTYVSQGANLYSNGATVVRLQNGSWMTWGDDQDYELGDGHTTNQASPIAVTVPAGTTTAVEGGLDLYAVTVSGVYALGAGGAYQLGGGKAASKTFVLSWAGAALAISSTAFSVAASC